MASILSHAVTELTVDFPKVAERVLWMARDLDDSRPAAVMEATRRDSFGVKGE